MRQRGERGYREDSSGREFREGTRGFGGSRSGGDDWERQRSQHRPYDEEYDEMEGSWGGEQGRGSDYGRQGQWPERYGAGERGFGQDLDEGRFQAGRRPGSEWQSGSYGQGRRYGQGDMSSFNQRYSGGQQPGSFGRQGQYSQGGTEQGRFGRWGYESRIGQWGHEGRSQQGGHAGKGPQGYRRSDERIREDLCDCLTDHPEIDPSNIDVKVDNCTVTLSGQVDSREAKRLAEDIAEGITGVQDVRNELRVQRSAMGESEPGKSGSVFGSAGETSRQRQNK
jgi:osmotically-inducible protein OsmY